MQRSSEGGEGSIASVCSEASGRGRAGKDRGGRGAFRCWATSRQTDGHGAVLQTAEDPRLKTSREAVNKDSGASEVPRLSAGIGKAKQGWVRE